MKKLLVLSAISVCFVQAEALADFGTNKSSTNHTPTINSSASTSRNTQTKQEPGSKLMPRAVAGLKLAGAVAGVGLLILTASLAARLGYSLKPKGAESDPNELSISRYIHVNKSPTVLNRTVVCTVAASACMYTGYKLLMSMPKNAGILVRGT
jgi:hypothetical protein